MNLSPGGFFVQTSAAADLGSSVSVTLLRSGKPLVDVEATVTNRRRVPPKLATVTRPGLGCKLRCAPSYFHLLGDLGA